MEALFTFTLFYFFVLFANFCLEIVEWSGVMNTGKLLIHLCLQILFCLVLSDCHNWMKGDASRSSTIIFFNTINRCQFFVPYAIGTKNWCQNPTSNLWRRFLECMSGA